MNRCKNQTQQRQSSKHESKYKERQERQNIEESHNYKIQKASSKSQTNFSGKSLRDVIQQNSEYSQEYLNLIEEKSEQYHFQDVLNPPKNVYLDRQGIIKHKQTIIRIFAMLFVKKRKQQIRDFTFIANKQNIYISDIAFNNLRRSFAVDFARRLQYCLQNQMKCNFTRLGNYQKIQLSKIFANYKNFAQKFTERLENILFDFVKWGYNLEQIQIKKLELINLHRKLSQLCKVQTSNKKRK